MATRVTMRDVARAAGVSPMTVSRAFKDDQAVNAETRMRIRQAADKLGYIFDSSATAFRTQKSGFVAVTLPSINNANFAETYRGLTVSLEGMGMQLLLGATNYRVEKEEELVRQLLTRNPEALVLTGGHHTQATRDIVKARGLPVIEMWDLPEAPLGHSVGFSNAAAMELIVKHLAKTGRRNLAFLGAADGADSRGAERRAGAQAAVRAHGLTEMAFINVGPAPVSMRHGAARLQELGDSIRSYDGLICVSDPVAFGAICACRKMGIRVPEDIAITGFGNFEVAMVSEPQITTVDVSAHKIGKEVGNMLTALFAGDARPDQIVIDTRLCIGGTA